MNLKKKKSVNKSPGLLLFIKHSFDDCDPRDSFIGKFKNRAEVEAEVNSYLKDYGLTSDLEDLLIYVLDLKDFSWVVPVVVITTQVKSSLKWNTA